MIKANDDLTPEHHQFFLYQMLRGLKYIHSGKRAGGVEDGGASRQGFERQGKMVVGLRERTGGGEEEFVEEVWSARHL